MFCVGMWPGILPDSTEGCLVSGARRLYTYPTPPITQYLQREPRRHCTLSTSAELPPDSNCLYTIHSDMSTASHVKVMIFAVLCAHRLTLCQAFTCDSRIYCRTEIDRTMSLERVCRGTITMNNEDLEHS